LSGVTALSRSDAWAVGYRHAPGTADYQPIAENWNGTSWRSVATATLFSTDATLGNVGVSPANVWAVGFYANDVTFRTLIEHWNGQRWQYVASPNSGTGENILSGVAATSGSDIWAVGTRQSTPGAARRTLVEHYDGHQWSVVTSPNVGSGDNLLSGVAVTTKTKTNAWAVGDDRVAYGSSMALHWNGHTWAVVKTVNPGDGERFLFGVAALGTRVLAVGSDLAGTETKTLAERWNGSRWLRLPSAGPGQDLNEFHDVAAESATNAWAVGYWRSTARAPFRTLAEYWDGSAWKLASSPSPTSGDDDLSGIAAIPAARGYLAVGEASGKVLVESYCLTG
jgi:hypothetical protein